MIIGLSQRNFVEVPWRSFRSEKNQLMDPEKFRRWRTETREGRQWFKEKREAEEAARRAKDEERRLAHEARMKRMEEEFKEIETKREELRKLEDKGPTRRWNRYGRVDKIPVAHRPSKAQRLLGTPKGRAMLGLGLAGSAVGGAVLLDAYK